MHQFLFQDVDECQIVNSCDNSQTGNICLNTEGSFFCSGCTSLSTNGNIWSYYRRRDCCLRSK